MVRLNLLCQNIVGSSPDEARRKTPEMPAGERIELRQYVSVSKALDIMTKPQQALYPHSGLCANGSRRLVLKIGYYKYSSVLSHISFFESLYVALTSFFCLESFVYLL
jgi:hypothetical protein